MRLSTSHGKLSVRAGLFALLLFLLFNGSTFAQPMSGTYTVGTGQYIASIAAAIDSINNRGISGAVTFNVIAGHTETFASPTAGTITATGTVSNTITFQKSGVGANPVITAGVGTVTTTDGIIKIAGGDYITFDGIDLAESAGNLTSTTQMEWGYALVKGSATAPFNGAQYITIKNCTVTLNKANTASVAVYSGNHIATATTGLTLTAAGDIVNYLTVDNVVTRNSFSGISINGYTTSATYYDNNIEVKNCNVQNYGGAATGYGIAATGCSTFTVVNNTVINYDGVTGSAATSTTYGIYARTGTGGTFLARGNTVTINRGSSASAIYGLRSDFTGPVTMNSNTLQNFVAGGSSGTIGFIYSNVGPSAMTVDSNTIQNSTSLNTTGTIYIIELTLSTNTYNLRYNTVQNISRVTGATGAMRGFYNNGGPTGGTATISNNTFYNLNNSSSSGALAAIYNNTSTTQQLVITNNIVRKLTAGSGGVIGIFANFGTTASVCSLNTVDTLTASGSIYGIQIGSSSTAWDISRNTLKTFSGTNSTGSTVAGIYITSGTNTTNSVISRNLIYDLTGTGSSAGTYGIYQATGGSSMNVYNNFISDLRAPASGNTTGVSGIYLSSGHTSNAHGVYFNTVFLNASSTSTFFGSTAMYIGTTYNLDMRNNIFVNMSLSGNGSALAKTAAYRRSSTSLTTYSANSNNNLFYVNPAASSKAIFMDGTNYDSTMAAFKTRMATRDQSSVSELPPFINTSTTPYDLHLNTGIATQAESGGATVSSPSITADYDGDVRNVTTPDIGADEFAGIGADLVGPSISYTALGNTIVSGTRSVTGINITDASSVNTTAGTRPRMYYKKINDANAYNDNTNATAGWKYVEANGTTSPFDFTMDFSLLNSSPLVTNDTVQYFFIAQDLAGTPNVSVAGVSLAGSVTTVALTGSNFPSTGTPPGFKILNSISGTYNVGTGQTYTTLTATGGFFELVNNSVVAGNLTVNITSDITETGTVALNQFSETGVGNYTLTIQPDAATVRTLSGTYTGGLIRLNGADRVTIDGRFSGSGTYLTISNLATASCAAVQLVSLGTGAGATNNTIRNVNVLNGSRIVTSTYGISVGGSTVGTSGDDNDNLTITNCNIYKSYYGIYASASASGTLGGLTINSNSLGNSDTTISLYNRGIWVSYATSPDISQNTIWNMYVSASINPKGIDIGTGVTGGTISRNKIHSIYYTGVGGYSGKGIDINTTGTVNMTISNNLIYNLGGDGWTNFTSDGMVGIKINGGTGYNLYYNTVYLAGLNSDNTGANVSAALYLASGVTGIDSRNNVYANLYLYTGSTTDKNYAVYSANVTNPFTTSNYNIYYAPAFGNYNGVVGYLNTADRDSVAFPTITLGDANSFYRNPVVTDSLNMIPSTGSPMASNGTPIGSVTIDYLGNTRSLTNPYIGAYETSADLSGPVISYTTLGNTTSTSNRTLTATITDASSVNFTGGTAPRIYYKKKSDANVFGGNTSGDNGWKWTETTTGSSPADFTLDFSIINGGSVTTGDTIQYFIVAQDLAGTPNVSANPSSGFVGTSVSSISVAPSSPNSYSILGSISGTFNIPGDYATLTAAVADYNNKVQSGAVVFQLAAGYSSASETFPITINQNGGSSATNTLTIKPAAGQSPTITGSGSALIKLNGADYVTIDGSNAGSASRNLTLANTATSSAAAIQVASLGTGAGATNNTLKNLIIYGAINSTSTVYGITAGGSTVGSAGDDNDDLTIQNDTIYKAYYGIYAAASSAGVNNNLTITGNGIGSSVTADRVGFYGIYLLQASTVTVSQNVVSDLYSSSTTVPYAIYLGAGVVNATVSRNKVANIQYTGSSGYGARGIVFVSGSATSNSTIANNVLYNILADGDSTAETYLPVGIMVGPSTGGVAVYYNSVNMYGSAPSNSYPSWMAAFYASSTASAMTIKNNVFVNSIVKASTNSSYAVFIGGANTTLTAIDYNDYYVSGSQGKLGYLNASRAYTLAEWQTLTGQDVNSKLADPVFNGNTNLTPQTGSAILAAGTPIGGITTDYIGATRSGSTPSMGAYENGGDAIGPTVTYTALTNTNSSANRDISVTLSDNTGINFTAGNAPRVYYKKNYAGTWYNTETTTGSSPATLTIDYSLIPGGISAGDSIYYFVVAQDLASTPNVTASPSAGFSGTSVSSITSYPSSPNKYKYVGAAMAAGDYTVGLTMFNKVTGKNLVPEMRKRTVTKVVPVVTERPAVDEKLNISAEAGYVTNTKAEYQTVEYKEVTEEEEYSVLTENGAVYTGDLFVAKKNFVANDDAVSINGGKEFDGINGVYATITAAVADAKDRGFGGNIRFLLVDATYPSETFPITLDFTTSATQPSASATITFKPSTGISPTVSGSSTTSIFKMVGADYVTFDGSNATNGTSRDWTITNTSTSSTSAVLWFASASASDGASNNTVKNLNVTGTANTSTTTGNGINFSGLATPGTLSSYSNNNNTLQNNFISKCYYAINFVGASTTIPDSNNTVTGNVLGSSTAGDGFYYGGIYGLSQVNFTVTANDVQNINGTGQTSNMYGIWVADSKNATVTRNKVHNLNYTGTSTTKQYGIEVSGANLNTAGNASAGTYANNMIYDISSTATSSYYNIAGFFILGGYGDKFYHNTVVMDDTLAGTSTGVNAAFMNGQGLTTGLDSVVTLVSNHFHVVAYSTGGTGSGYAYYTTKASLATSSLNSNVYYSAAGTGGATANLGYMGVSSYATLSAWQTATGKDTLSKSFAASFVSHTDGHLAASMAGNKNLQGKAVVGVSTDIDGDTRHEAYPYAGADELSTPLAIKLNFTVLIEAMYDGTSTFAADTVTLRLRRAASPFTQVDSAVVMLSGTGTASPYFTNGYKDSTYYIQVYHRNALDTWTSSGGINFSSATMTHDMTSAAAQAYGSNMVLKGSKYCLYSGDVNKDGLVDLSDLLAIDNDNANFASGYLVTDVNNDQLTDLTDLLVADNNNAAFISAVTPLNGKKPIAKRVISNGETVKTQNGAPEQK